MPLALPLKRFMPRSKEVEPYSTNGVSYGVFFNTRGTDLTGGRYVAGVAVRVDAPVSEGWVARDIPAAEYAVFDTSLGEIWETADEALGKWLPNSDFEQDTSRPRFDHHPPALRGKTLLCLCGSP